jgi:HK97 family phage portal protein
MGIAALKNSDVLTAVSIIATDVARFPILIRDKRTREVQNMPNLDYLMNTKANNSVSAYTWRFSMTVNAILTGNAYSRIIRDPITEEPSMLEFYPPSQTNVNYNDRNHIIYTFMPAEAESNIVCQAQDVIHWKFMTYDTIMGRSPLLSLGDEIGLQNSGVKTLQKFFQSGMKGSILKAKGRLNAESRQKIRQDFERAQSGAAAGGAIVVDDTMDYQPLQIDTNILNLINSNNYSTAQIAKVLRVPAYRLAQNSPNQSVKQLSDDYIKNDLPHYFNPIASEFVLKFLRDDERANLVFDFDTRSVTGMPVQDINTATAGGIMTGNEGRGEIGLPPLPDENMNRIQSDLNHVFLDKKQEYQDKNTITDLKGGGKNANEEESGDSQGQS